MRSLLYANKKSLISHSHGTSDLLSTCCHPISEMMPCSFPSSQIRRMIHRIYPSPDNAGAAASVTGADARSPRFSQTHSPDSVYIGITPSPTLCATVLPATYFCSWNLTFFIIRIFASFVKCFPEKSVDFVISDKFEQFRFNDTHKFRRHTAYLFHTAAYAWTIRNAVSPNRRYDPCCNFLKFWHLFVPGVSVR